MLHPANKKMAVTNPKVTLQPVRKTICFKIT
jgi:hypothetical protein